MIDRRPRGEDFLPWQSRFVISKGPRTTGTSSQKTPASPEGSKALRIHAKSDLQLYRSARGNRSTGKDRSPASGLYAQCARRNNAQKEKSARPRWQSTVPVRGPRLGAPVSIDAALPSRSTTTPAPHTPAVGDGQAPKTPGSGRGNARPPRPPPKPAHKPPQSASPMRKARKIMRKSPIGGRR